MKNKFIIFAVLMIILAVGLGCGVSETVEKAVTGSDNANASNADNKAIVDKAIDTAFGGEKIGVKECDDLYDYVGELVTRGENEDYVTRAARQYFLNRIREQIKGTVEQYKNDKKQLATECADYRRQIDAFINQQANDSNNQESGN
jgi:hypothetical protein